MLGLKKKYTTRNSRRYKRLHADYLVKFRLAGTDSELLVSNIKDISAGGLRFWSREFFHEGSLLQIHVWIPPIGCDFQTLGRVIRTRRAKEGKVYYMGVSFLEVTKEHQRALNEFIEEVSQSEAPYPLVNHAETVKRCIPWEKV